MKDNLFAKVLLLPICIALVVPANLAMADEAGDRADYERRVNKKIDDLKLKISEEREDYKKEGVRVNQKIQEYEDRIEEIRREANAKLADKDQKNKDKNREDTDHKVSSIRQNFHEWRFKRAMNNYEDRIEDLKYKASNETDPEEKSEFEEDIKKLEAKYNAAKAKFADLQATDGENWDKIQLELDSQLKEIDRDYDAIEEEQERAEREAKANASQNGVAADQVK